MLREKLNLLEVYCSYIESDYLHKLIDVLRQLFEKEKIEVLLSGKLSTGKTTILNSLLDRNILPTGIGTTTRTINFVFYDKSDEIEVLYKDKTSKKFPLSKDAITEINKDENVEAIYIKSSEFPYLTVSFTDTPGIDDLEENLEKLTLSRIPYADAVIFVLDASKGLTIKDKKFFDNFVVKYIRDKVFIFFNKLDVVSDEISEDEIEKIKKDLMDYPVFFGSAKLRDEGFLSFKTAVENYIKNTTKSGNIKRRGKQILNSIQEIVESYHKLKKEYVGKSKEELERRLTELSEKKKLLDQERAKLEKEVETELQKNVEKVSEIFERYRQLIVDEIFKIDPDFLKEYFYDGTFKSRLRELVREVGANISINLDEIDLSLGSKFIITAIDWLGMLDPVLENFDLGDWSDLIQNFVRGLSKNVLIADVERILDKIYEDTVGAIRMNVNEYFENIMSKHSNDVSMEIAAVSSSLKYLESSKEDLDKELAQISKNVDEIKRLTNLLMSELERSEIV